MADVAVVVYGATGFTGRLVCSELQRRNVPFAVAGRDRAKLTALSASLTTARPEVLVAPLDDRAALEQAIARGRVVLACAGPFARMGEPVREAALAARRHYLDITGESELHAGDVRARRRGARPRRRAGERGRLRRRADRRGGRARVGSGGRQAGAVAHRHGLRRPRDAGHDALGARARRQGRPGLHRRQVRARARRRRSLARGLPAAGRRSRVRLDPVGRPGDGAALDGRAHASARTWRSRRRWRG